MYMRPSQPTLQSKEDAFVIHKVLAACFLICPSRRKGQKPASSADPYDIHVVCVSGEDASWSLQLGLPARYYLTDEKVTETGTDGVAEAPHCVRDCLARASRTVSTGAGLGQPSEDLGTVQQRRDLRESHGIPKTLFLFPSRDKEKKRLLKIQIPECR